jgi:hypothetical protein
MSNFGRRAAIAAVACATVGSTVFGGAALAVEKKDGRDKKHVEVTNPGGGRRLGWQRHLPLHCRGRRSDLDLERRWRQPECPPGLHRDRQQP